MTPHPHTGIVLIIGMALGIGIHAWSGHEASARDSAAEAPSQAPEDDGQATMEAAFRAAQWRARGGWSYPASPDARYDIHLRWGECGADKPDASGCVDPTTDPDVIYLDQSWFADHQDDPAGVVITAALDTASHELAHLAVYDKCGTTHPPIIPEDRVENVTDTIATLYLGMAPRREGSTTPDGYAPDGYGLGIGDEDTARAIWEGQCEPR